MYYALRSIFGGWILFILCNTQYSRWSIFDILRTAQYFRRVDIIYTTHYTVFSGVGYYLYNAIRSFKLVDIRYTKDCAVFMLMDTACTTHYTVFSGDGYYLYYAIRSIHVGRYSIY